MTESFSSEKLVKIWLKKSFETIGPKGKLSKKELCTQFVAKKCTTESFSLEIKLSKIDLKDLLRL